MTRARKFEILDALPATGPAYIPVSDDGRSYSGQGFVVRFFSSGGESWVANFKPGLTEFNDVFDFESSDKVAVIAGGALYVMNPDEHKPEQTYGASFRSAIRLANQNVLLMDDTQITEVKPSGALWGSPRISWDGFKAIVVEHDKLTGLSFDPMDAAHEWVPFSIDLSTKEVEGGSYLKYYLEPVTITKKWWKFW